MIKIKDLNKYFNKGKQNEIHVINNVDIELPERGMVSIFGRSGCGKTTLLNVIGGLDSAAGGSVTIDDNNIRRNTDVIRNKYIGYIFQNYNLNKNETCFENVADALRLCGMTDRDEIESRTMAALRNVGMDKYRSRTPDTLSGGQQQRIAIARAIVKNPKIILADEPTGNLDEENTILVMDLLKQISKDHLVLIVTHEAKLVDYYCDTVIEMSDGKIVNVRENTSANGFTARSKNDIYLGEYEKSELSDSFASVEYYGEQPKTPVNLRIVNHGGKLYVEIRSADIQVLDSSSEIKFREGVYEVSAAKTDKASSKERIDMSALPPIEGKKFGKLFTLRSSIKSGYVSNFKKRKVGNKLLRVCLCLFAAVIVFMSAMSGTAFNDLISVSNSYNHNVFYVASDADGATSQKLVGAVGSSDSGIDYVRILNDIPQGDRQFKFMTGFFESFASNSYDESFTTNAVLLGMPLADGLELVAGKRDGLADAEVLITTAVADDLLDKSCLGYISEYDDLIGLVTRSVSIDGKNLRIAGVVEGDETAVYASELALAKYTLAFGNVSLKTPSSMDNYSADISDGETVVIVADIIHHGGDKEESDDGEEDEQLKVGDKITIRGKTFTVADTIINTPDYMSWLKVNGYEMEEDPYEYFKSILGDPDEYYNDPNRYDKEDGYEYDPYSDFYDKVNERYYEYHEKLLEHVDEYINEAYMFSKHNQYLWLAVEKGNEMAKYSCVSGYGIEYYFALQYKKELGRMPTQSELSEYLYSEDKNAYDIFYKELDAECQKYQSEINKNNFSSLAGTSFIVTDNDYIALSKQIGKTDESAYSYGSDGGMIYREIVDVEVNYGSISSSSDVAFGEGSSYVVIHSSDPKKTDTFLKNQFSSVKAPTDLAPAIVSPDYLHGKNIANYRENIIINIITLLVVLALMSVCMYFIMRSSLMNRIKEIGIYRAIGVSKKNMLFKFFIEAIILTTLTVMVGFIATSAVVIALTSSSMMSTILFYPVWYAAALFVVLYAICIVCGTIPILSLVKKTPSAILSKYDI